MVPSILLAGDTCTFTFVDSRYPSSSWVLTCILNASAQLNVTATAESDDSFTVTLTAAQTAPLKAGLYPYALRVSNAGEVYTVDSGYIEVRPNPLYAAGSISVASRMLDLIDTALLGQLSDGDAIEAMSISGRSLTNISRLELLEERAYWQLEFQRLKGAKNGSSGIRSIRLDIGRF